ncbi:MAG: autotransporter domain-containing protein [Alphaproteobacteria bacterium]|nr:autotransporter domain-containing protein [Alphaproteobacteria bacterium]MBU1514556.1 autotransporter domain-containing protein [Alphaproteobacteria bacterium]MBU2096812.1 autotransporter domain-containing protein [Alphaproteobacteria bacterium]MBU2153439.1 autotransporter domain-containing protein [Alphaproteobacteria bacterium]MBU2306056.1 autotransporter domain-containing protein [Alphaproteobacteria bacterium]
MLRTVFQVPHLRATLMAACAVLTVAVPAGAQTISPYNRVVVFGDSISDGGAYASLAPAGAGRFTTNPDPVWVERIASGLGLDLKPRAAGGTNYAEGGARVAVSRPGAPGDLSRTPVVNQVDAWLAGGGVFARGDLVIIQGGGNDVFFTQTNGLTFTPVDLAVLDQAAQDLAGQVRRIEAAGQATVVTTSVPRFEVFNARYRAALAAAGPNVLYIDMARLISEIETQPAEFGITNVTDRACRGRAVESFTCLPADYVAPDANRTYLFADGVHFTGVVHEIEADAVLGALRAPAQVGQLPLAGEAVLQSVHAGLVAQLGAEGPMPAGSWSVFGWADASRLDLDRSARATGLRSDAAGVTVGGAYALDSSLSAGGAISWSDGDGDFGGDTGGFDLRTAMVTVFARGRMGAFDALADASYADLAFDDVSRRIRLGPAERIEQGDTHGRMWAAGLEVGTTTQAGPFRVRPLASLRYERVDVGAYAEAGARATQATFGDQRSERLWGSIGAEFRLAPSPAWVTQPFLRLAYQADLLDDGRTISMTPAGAPLAFTTKAATADGDFLAYAVGATRELRPGLSLTAQVAGRLGSDSSDTTALRLGIVGRF